MLQLRKLYYRFISEETRYWLYKLRHWDEVESIQTNLHPSSKGDFSLRKYTEKECLFIHITKAAGTSVALSLIGELPYHYTAQQYRVIYGRKKFNRYFKFTFVRNPWDRLYSAYSYLKGGGWNKYDENWAHKNLSNIADFNQFVLEWLTPERLCSHIHFKPQLEFICDSKGLPLVNFLGYFENINEDFKFLAEKLNPEASLSHTNHSARGGYKEAYTPEAIEKVGLLYKSDIETLGYSFEGIHRATVIKDGKFQSL